MHNGNSKTQKKFVSRNVFPFLNAYYSNIHLIQSLTSLGSLRPYRRLLENKKTGGSKELFLPENDFQNSPTNNFLKNIKIFEAWKLTADIKCRPEFFCNALLHITQYDI